MQDEPEILYVCTECSADSALDKRSLVLYLLRCNLHGLCWHRKMIRRGEALLLAEDRFRKPEPQEPKRKNVASEGNRSSRRRAC
jgi:hypothetical protein